MDSAEAALLGSLIGGGTTLIAGVLFPSISSAISRRADARAALRVEQRSEIDAFTRSGTTMCEAVMDGGRPEEPWSRTAVGLSIAFVTAGQRLALVIPRESEDVNRMVSMTVEASRGEFFEFLATFDACKDVLLGWYRGTCAPGRVRREFESRLVTHRQEVALARAQRADQDGDLVNGSPAA